MDDFYAARSSSMPPLPWTSFSPPFSGFTVNKDGERWASDRRELRSLNLHEISIVSAHPAYDGTIVTARRRPAASGKLVAARRFLDTCL